MACPFFGRGTGLWDFLEDFATVRNAIIHANGNKTAYARLPYAGLRERWADKFGQA